MSKCEMVCGFYFDTSIKRVLLLRRTVKSHWQYGFLNGIGGKIEVSETPHEAMSREFMEEVGVNIDPTNWHKTIVLSGDDWRVHFFRAFGNYIEIGECEEGQLEWWSWDYLPKEIMPNLKWLIPMHHGHCGLWQTEFIETVDDSKTDIIKLLDPGEYPDKFDEKYKNDPHYVLKYSTFDLDCAIHDALSGVLDQVRGV